ncbi:TPA: VWA domain-containing protein [Photobacterium damselae]
MGNMMEKELERRWRLILGRSLSYPLNDEDRLRDVCLEELYSYEYQNRYSAGALSRQGGQGTSIPNPIDWLNKVKKAFPKSSVEILQKHGLEHYGLSALLLDEEILKQQKPDLNLLQLLLSFREQIPPQLESELERIITTVCGELEEVLSQQVQGVFTRHRITQTHSRTMPLSYTDWQRTIMRNLKHYQIEQNTLILERPFFYQTQHNQIPWDIYLVVDQSGSMLDSLIHASVLATVFCRLPMLNVHLYLFDTRVVDLTEYAHDALHTLLNVQLGGGTDIGLAMEFTRQQIHSPQRTMVVLISDFYEGGSPSRLLSQVKVMAKDGVTLLGLTALDGQGEAHYDNRITQSLLREGMNIAAMTPEHLSRWVAQVIRT